MAEWKTQLSYNYNPPYHHHHHHHAYAYGLTYQAGSEPTAHGSPPGWVEHGLAELGSYTASTTTTSTTTGVGQAYYAAAAATNASTAASRPGEDSPPGSPEQSVLNHHGYHHGYHHHGLQSRLYLPGQHAGNYDPLAANNNNDDDGGVGGGGGGRTRSGTPTSDSEAHTSPDSWSSASSREEGIPQADPASWIKREFDDDAETASPDASPDGVSSILEESQTLMGMASEDADAACPPAPVSKPTPAPKTPRTTDGRGRLRTAFSEGQMTALVQRFNAQRYLNPAEMKNLAAQLGMTYKQVKTWFQNRRMKLRRHQKDTSWVSENAKSASAANPNHATYSNMAPRLQQYQGDVRTHVQEPYSQQHMMEAGGVYKNTPHQNLAYYLAAMGTAGYHGSWSTGGLHTASLPSRPQGPGWPMAPAANPQQPYDYSSPSAYSVTGPLPASSADSSANSDSRADSPLRMALVQNAGQ
ncbi:Homeobox protein NANOG [Merluccius polli]|uniref:Homeobox protein NANOG n=1 Tax=Merluccius polli TaxID=89951 RepID=A0AA47MZZ9_MERPO|nr:Homeobox protein NANOG [Merluccius polli]